MTVSPRSTPELEALAKLYFPSLEDLGVFLEIGEEDLPAVFRMLLAHHQHMTVTLEAHNGCPLEVEVLQATKTDTHYQRKVLLRRTSDQSVVLFGIARLTWGLLAPDIQDEIESQRTPLGTILARKNIYRDVRLLSLWRIEPAAGLCELFGLESPQTLYGRTALMYCDSIPVIELLEIVTAD